MRKFTIIFTIFVLFITACSDSYEHGEHLINAENYGGLAFADKSVPVNEPVEVIPVIASTFESYSEAEPFSELTEPEEETTTSEQASSTQETTTAATTSATQATTTATYATQPPVIDITPSVRPTINYDEVIGVWISYIELSGILTGKTEAQFRQSYGAMMDNCKSLGINTVYVHLRPFGDALYKSEYFPWSKYVTGTIGMVPTFDPLEVMLEETHKRNISFHGWLNPMRLHSDADIDKISEVFAVGKWYNDVNARGKYIVKCGGNWYLNPAYSEVIELIGNGAAEIVSKYNVDGIHIDDYFYPVTDSWFDSAAFNSSSYTSLSAFRLNNCSNMVRVLYSSVKKVNPNALFGVSPQGSIENNYNLMFADVEKWCKNPGFVDYIAPQFYYGFENSTQPYIECINGWQKMLENSDVKLIMGLAVYKIGAEDRWAGDGLREWIDNKQILRRQIDEARKLKSYSGIAFYSYNWLFNPVHLTPAIEAEIAAFKPLL
ncbi:MAG: family 10 glycosylhydrolase [Oscillospiraceae bacterium]|nr:family 10 glycosylhydrolase [Oscillospiraceae bacterium]